MKVVVTLLLLLTFAACTTQLYVPTTANVSKHEAATLAELQQGHDLYSSKCGRCHSLKKPSSRTAAQWTKILEKMGPKAKLSKDQTALVYKYVVNY